MKSQIDQLENQKAAAVKEMARPHQERVSPQGTHSVDFYGLIHAPIHNYHQIPEAKQALEGEWEKLEKIPAWDMKGVRSKAEVRKNAQKTGNGAFCATNGTVLPQKRRIGKEAPNV